MRQAAFLSNSLGVIRRNFARCIAGPEQHRRECDRRRGCEPRITKVWKLILTSHHSLLNFCHLIRQHANGFVDLLVGVLIGHKESEPR